MLEITKSLAIPDAEISISAIRASGPGGQNVNKVATAAHLRFDIAASRALDDDQKLRLLATCDRRITADGVINIKAQRFRSLEKNREDALARLANLVRAALVIRQPRKKTVPGRREKEKRLAEKMRRAKQKQSRGRVSGYED